MSSFVSDVKVGLLNRLRKEIRKEDTTEIVPDGKEYSIEWVFHLNDQKRFDELIGSIRIIIADENICRLVKDDVSLQTPFILGHEAEFNVFKFLLSEVTRLQEESVQQRIALIEKGSNHNIRKENMRNMMNLIDGETK